MKILFLSVWTIYPKFLVLISVIFQTNVDALINNKLEKHKNLQEQSSFYWSEIELGTLKFDKKEMEVCSSLVILVLASSIKLDQMYHVGTAIISLDRINLLNFFLICYNFSLTFYFWTICVFLFETSCWIKEIG